MSTERTRSRYPAPRIPECPDCKCPMEPGIVPDSWNAILSDRTVWVQGTSKDSVRCGLDLAGKLAFPIVSFRCGNCGLLREYAFRPTQRLG